MRILRVVPSLLFLFTACSDAPDLAKPEPEQPLSTSDAYQWETVAVPAIEMDLPPETRPWDTSDVALTQAISSQNGHAVVAFKAPTSPRVLEHTGSRAVKNAVPAAAIERGLEVLNHRGIEVIRYMRHLGLAAVRTSPEAGIQLRDHPLVDFVEPRQWLHLADLHPSTAVGMPMDAQTSQMTPWGVAAVDAPDAWTKTSGWGTKILVIDTGHERGHPDLPYVELSNCGGGYGGCTDTDGHGTHVLGIIAARNNSEGVVGVAPGIRAADTYVWGACTGGGCSTSEIAAGIDQGITWDVDLINMSLGGDYSSDIALAVGRADEAGIVQIAAAGNHCHEHDLCAENGVVYPAGHTQDVIGVSGVNPDYHFAHPGSGNSCEYELFPGTLVWNYSNWASHVDVTGPFWGTSTVPGDAYREACGTSMATPHVSGVVALIVDRAPALWHYEIEQRLSGTAVDLATAGWDDSTGHGLVHAYKAVGPHASVIGPNPVPPNTMCEWEGNAPGGYGDVEYEWYRDDVLVSTSWRYQGDTGSSDFQLRFRAVDSQGIDDNYWMWIVVDDDPEAAECEA